MKQKFPKSLASPLLPPLTVLQFVSKNCIQISIVCADSTVRDIGSSHIRRQRDREGAAEKEQVQRLRSTKSVLGFQGCSGKANLQVTLWRAKSSTRIYNICGFSSQKSEPTTPDLCNVPAPWTLLLASQHIKNHSRTSTLLLALFQEDLWNSCARHCQTSNPCEEKQS